MSTGRFTDRVLFITGAGSGLARATAKLFAAEGAKVFAVDVNPDGLAETILAIRLAGGTAEGGRGQASAAHYAASKAGLVNFTRSIALEFASRGLRANCLAPAGIMTPIIKNFIPRPDFERSLVAYYSPPVPHQMSKPEDMAKTIAFLASDDVPMITGATLVADWGTLA